MHLLIPHITLPLTDASLSLVHASSLLEGISDLTITLSLRHDTSFEQLHLALAALYGHAVLSPLAKVRIVCEELSDIEAAVRFCDVVAGLAESNQSEYQNLVYKRVIPSPTTPMSNADSKLIPVDDQAMADRRVVVLGGTFDHLHQGHLILLSMAAFLAKEKLICGVYDYSETQERLLKKAHHQFMEPLEARIQAVTEFLNLFKPSITYRVEPILDDFGPTRTEVDVQAIVCSEETERGCFAVNELRRKNGLCLLDIYVIGCVGGNDAGGGVGGDSIQNKMSSSGIRKYLSERVHV
ncbi:hypothetical protein HDU98_008012 [Podochytrium sp. JEL0797]|nr:hypothetical protein HDU98_008012 [Podochytrium sp. JEL0797]